MADFLGNLYRNYLIESERAERMIRKREVRQAEGEMRDQHLIRRISTWRAGTGMAGSNGSDGG